jgi:hypothetical protein
MNSDPQEGHPNFQMDGLLCNSHPVAYGWSWDFKSGRRVTYDIRGGNLEVYYTDKGNPMEGYPKVMDESELLQLLRAVLQLEGTMSKKYHGEMRKLFEELDAEVQDGLLQVDNTRGNEVDDTVLAGVRAKVLKLNELLGIMEPRIPDILPKQKADALANLPVKTAVAKDVSINKPEEKKSEAPDLGFWGKPQRFLTPRRPV